MQLTHSKTAVGDEMEHNGCAVILNEINHSKEKIEELKKEVKGLQDKVEKLKEAVTVLDEKFKPINKLVGGMVWIVIISVLGTALTLILRYGWRAQ